MLKSSSLCFLWTHCKYIYNSILFTIRRHTFTGYDDILFCRFSVTVLTSRDIYIIYGLLTAHARSRQQPVGLLKLAFAISWPVNDGRSKTLVSVASAADAETGSTRRQPGWFFAHQQDNPYRISLAIHAPSRSYKRRHRASSERRPPSRL